MSDSTDQYIDWKDWRDDSFGRFDALEAQYYAEETHIAARPGAARMGTMTIMRRLYSLEESQTIELLVIYLSDAWEA